MWKDQLKDIKKKLDAGKATSAKEKEPTIKILSVSKKQIGESSQKKRNNYEPKSTTGFKQEVSNKKKGTVESKALTKKKKHRKKKQKKIVDEPLNLISHFIKKEPTAAKKPSQNNNIYKLAAFESLSTVERGSLVNILNPTFSYDSIQWLKPGNSKSDDILDVFIGLDFGTAFTKVVIGAANYHYVLDFGVENGLLPSKFWVDQNGECYLNPGADRISVTELKLPLLLNKSKIIDRIAILAFLALVFKKCRDWLNESPYVDHSPQWFINGGLPTESYHNESLKSEYLDLITIGWQLSYAKTISLEGAQALLTKNVSEIPDFAKLESEQVELFPEFIAQITGYVRSSQRRQFSHLLIDVGAGTLDVALFDVKNLDGDWKFYVSSRKIDTLGADILNKHRCICAGENEVTIDSTYVRHNEDVAACLNISVDELTRIDEPFETKVNENIRNVINVLGQRSKLQKIVTFFCGGGREAEPYKKALSPVLEYFPTEMLDIPVPENLQAPLNLNFDYHRLSVAYGLSNDPYDIGEAIQNQLDEVEVLSARSQRLQSEIDNNRSSLYKS